MPVFLISVESVELLEYFVCFQSSKSACLSRERNDSAEDPVLEPYVKSLALFADVFQKRLALCEGLRASVQVDIPKTIDSTAISRNNPARRLKITEDRPTRKLNSH